MGLLGDVATNPQLTAAMTMKREHWSDGVFPETLMDKNGTEQATVDALDRKKVVGVLFSANWSTRCQDFVPRLASFYHTSQKWHGMKLEIVFVSSDRNERAFRACLDKMPWLAVSYQDAAATAKLTGICQVRNIPALVILDGATGDILTTAGCNGVYMAQSGDRSPPAIVKSWLGLGQRGSEPDLSPSARAVSAVFMLVVTAVVHLVKHINSSHDKNTGAFHES